MITPGKMTEIFGFRVPTDNYYLHRGHAWVLVENDDLVRVGLDDFSQKLIGPADEVRLPEIGKCYFQDHICMSLLRQGRKASFETPVDGVIVAVNTGVLDNPGLLRLDPYREGWLFLVKPGNLQCNLANLFSGETNVTWINEESARLLQVLDQTIGVVLPDGVCIIDDVITCYPDLNWRHLVKEFFLRHLSSRGFLPPTRRKHGC
jgi:glycine cleavage system H lipoate-binding protein